MTNAELIEELEGEQERSAWDKNILSIIISRLKIAEEMAESLELILPLAKGYIQRNKVGSNQLYINTATQALEEWNK